MPKPHLRKPAVSVAASILAVLGWSVTTGCDGRNQYVAPPPPEVTVSRPLQKNVTEYLEFTGTTEAVATVEIRARVKGFLQEVHFQEGDTVKKDALLFTIDPSEYEASLNQATASVAVATAGLEIAEATLSRMNEAAKTNAVSVIQVLESKAKRDQAAATLRQRQAELEKVKLDLSYTKILAPMDGRIGEKLVDEGNLVGATDNTLLTTIVQYDPIYAAFSISERDVLTLMKRTAGKEVVSAEDRLAALRKIPVELGLAGEKGYPHSGFMHFTEQGLDPGTRTLLVKAIFPNPDPVKILPGLYARVRSPFMEREDALLITERALGSDQSGRYLLVVDDQNVVQHRSVAVGRKLDGMCVITSGLKAEDRVIVNGLLRARPGGKVTPLEEKPEAKPQAKPETKPETESKSKPRAEAKAPQATPAKGS